MDCYNEFASIYDALTYDVDYDEYVEYLEKIFSDNSVKPELILDLGCGTGSVTERLYKKGYDMIGVDSSMEMLDVATEKLDNTNVLFLCQDMTEFELYGTVDVIVCSLDCINYIDSTDKLEKVFKLAHNYLNNGGLFIFDINSEYKLTQTLGNNTFVNEEDGIFYVWENATDGLSTTFYLNFFIKDDNGKYERIEEVHTETVYKETEILDLLNKSGFSNIKTYDGYSFNSVKPESDRINFVCKK